MESCQSSCPFVVWLPAQNAAPTAEYLPDVRAGAEDGWEKHSLDSRGRCETVSPGSFLPGHDESRPQCARQLFVCACFPGAQIPAPAGPEEASAGVQEECRQSHRKIVTLDGQARAGRSSVRSRR